MSYPQYPPPDNQEREPIIRVPITTRPPREQYPAPVDDIEIIDLDSDRRQVKPTTWH
jgi:hypothetical protein